MKKERVLESEVRAALRSNGIATIQHVETVVLETNGNFSVTKISEHKETFSAFANIKIPRAPDQQLGRDGIADSLAKDTLQYLSNGGHALLLPAEPVIVQEVMGSMSQ